MNYKIAILFLTLPFLVVGQNFAASHFNDEEMQEHDMTMDCCSTMDMQQPAQNDEDCCQLSDAENSAHHSDADQDGCAHNSCNHQACCIVLSPVWFFAKQIQLPTIIHKIDKDKNLYGLKSFSSIDVRSIWIPPKIIA